VAVRASLLRFSSQPVSPTSCTIKLLRLTVDSGVVEGHTPALVGAGATEGASVIFIETGATVGFCVALMILVGTAVGAEVALMGLPVGD
jgi:hypothetical protein